MKASVFSACLAAALIVSGQAQAGKKLDSLFNIDMLNVQIAYLETILGPAKSVVPLGGPEKHEFREYIVEGCKLYVDANKGNAIKYTLPLTPKCQADLSKIVREPKSTKGLTVGKFQSIHGDMAARASCLGICGNAADPVAEFIWEGPHAANFVRIGLGVTLASDAALNAAEKWQRIMEAKEGEDYVISTKFNCTNKYDSFATNAFKNVAVDSISFDFQTSGDPYASECGR